jgi:hypothetical protein
MKYIVTWRFTEDSPHIVKRDDGVSEFDSIEEANDHYSDLAASLEKIHEARTMPASFVDMTAVERKFFTSTQNQRIVEIAIREKKEK